MPSTLLHVCFMTIVLSTLNARYSHALLGLRYLYANMAELQHQTHIEEFVIGSRTTDLVERLCVGRHREKLIIGFGVYIWNMEETCKLVAQLKRVAPEVVIVLGGPGSVLQKPKSRKSSNTLTL